MKIRIEIYQTNKDVPYKFMGMKMVENIFHDYPRKADYHRVWAVNSETPVSMEDLYEYLNTGRKPTGYKGHSLSVSDIIRYGNDYWFVDSVGFSRLDAGRFLDV